MSKEGGFTFSNPGFTNPPGGPSAPNYQPPPQPSAYQQSGFPPTGPPPPYPGESSGGFPNQAPNFSSNSQTFTHNTSSFNQSGNTFTHNTSSYTNTGNTFTHSGTNQTSNVVITTRPTHVVSFGLKSFCRNCFR